MSRRSLRRFGVMTFCLLWWISGGVYYWLREIPVLPQRVFPRSVYGLPVRATARGELVYLTLRLDNEQYGPVRFFDPFSGKLEREFLSSADRVRCLSERGDWIVSERGDSLTVLDAQSGQTTYQMPSPADLVTARISEDGQWLLVQRGDQHDPANDQITAWNVLQRTEVWTQPCTRRGIWPSQGESESLESIVDGRVKLKRQDANHANPPATAWWKLSDGTPLDDAPQQVVELSADGQLAIVEDGAFLTVCEFKNSHALWSVPLRFRNYGMHFSEDGRQVLCCGEPVGADGNRSLKLMAWDARTGPDDIRKATADVGVIDRRSDPITDSIVSSDRQHLIVNRFAQPWEPPKWVFQLYKTIGIRWSLGSQPTWHEFVDWPSGRIGGIAPAGATARLPSRDGVWITDGEGVRIYTFTPSRNWLWLAGWCAAGPAAAVVVAQLARALNWRRLRRRAIAEGGLK